jgi:hydrogenase maturation protease
MLIICCGRPDRGDDAAGPLVAGRLREIGIPVVDCGGEALALMQAWRGAEDVLVVQAVFTGAPSGTLTEWDAVGTPLAPRWFHCSAHALGLADAVGLARKLGRLPKRLRVLGIDSRRYEAGRRPSAAVARASQEAAERIAREVAASSLSVAGEAPG